MTERTIEDLRMKQALPLDVKILLTQSRIRQWVNEFDEDGVCVSFSGGKDSTVLLDIVRKMYPNVEAVFVDTGLEYPEIREFVKTFDNVTWLKPKMNFKQVITAYGYPFISKEISGSVYETRVWLKKNDLSWSKLLEKEKIPNMAHAHRIADFIGIDRQGENKYSKEYTALKCGDLIKIPIRTQYLLGSGLNPNNGKLSPYNKAKWSFLLSSPFDISHHCCNVIKKTPIKNYQKKSNKMPMTAQMACESRLRTSHWIKNGCNGFQMKSPISNPMSFWTEQDVLQYIKKNNLPICSVYGDVVVDDKTELQGQETWGSLGVFETDVPKLKTTGCSRTGCMFCGFGCHLEKEGEGRFERMKLTHPKQYEYIMKPKEQGGLDYKNVIDWINENGNLHIRY